LDFQKNKDRDLEYYQTIIFDCDGVIFDSNRLKSNLFREVLSCAGYNSRIVEDFIAYHQAAGGVSRYKKIKLFITNFLKQEFDITLYNQLLASYSTKCVDMYESAKLTSGIIPLLKKYNNKTCYVASGSDEEELKEAFRKRNIDSYFQEIFGSPKSKNRCVELIMLHNLKKEPCVLIGDSVSDFEASLLHKIDFIFVRKYSENIDCMISLSKQYGFRTVNTAEDLLLNN
jgi:HAD superfamily hydrolase (TIGR01549 family)